MTKDEKLRAILEIPVPKRARQMAIEERDAQWADFGRTVGDRLMSDELADVLNRAALRSKTTGQMVRHLRLFILTGAKP
jgi:hypothetical protein